MSTKSKSVLGACLVSVVGLVAAAYVEDAQTRVYIVGVAALIAGKLGFKQPGQ